MESIQRHGVLKVSWDLGEGGPREEEKTIRALLCCVLKPLLPPYLTSSKCKWPRLAGKKTSAHTQRATFPQNTQRAGNVPGGDPLCCPPLASHTGRGRKKENNWTKGEKGRKKSRTKDSEPEFCQRGFPFTLFSVARLLHIPRRWTKSHFLKTHTATFPWLNEMAGSGTDARSCCSNV